MQSTLQDSVRPARKEQEERPSNTVTSEESSIENSINDLHEDATEPGATSGKDDTDGLNSSKNTRQPHTIICAPKNTVSTSAQIATGTFPNNPTSNYNPGPGTNAHSESSGDRVTESSHGAIINQNQSNRNPNSGRNNPVEGIIGDSSEITTIREFSPEQSTSVSGVLRFCKRRILFPYLKLLGIMGLKPLCYDNGDDTSICWLVVSKLYLILVGVLLLTGYMLQFMTCYRRDNGFTYEDEITNPPSMTGISNPSNLSLIPAERMALFALGNMSRGMNHRTSNGLIINNGLNNAEQAWILEKTICKGNLIYVYVIPSTFHFLSFVYMVYLYWLNDDEQLQNLMERVFIQSSHVNINVFSKKRLSKGIKTLAAIGCCWIVFITAFQVLEVYLRKIYLNFWIQADYDVRMMVALVLLLSTIWQDAIQITIVISFAIHCNLICTYTELIRKRVMQHSMSLSECMKELGELGQILRYLNEDLGMGLAPLLLIDSMYAAGSVVNIIQLGNNLNPIDLVSHVLIAILWLFIVLFPLTQAARVSTCCEKLKRMGHDVRMRPFGYQRVPLFDLDSFLLFVSNLKFKARIFKVPITSANLSTLTCFLFLASLLWGYFQ